MKYSHIIFDFNGTILNDVETGIKSINVLLSRRNLPLIDSVAKYHSFFRFPIIDYYRAVGFDIDGEGYDVLAHEWVEQYMKFSADAKMYDGVARVLSELKSRGARLVMLTMTERAMLEKQLIPLGIRDYFDDIVGLDNIYAESKLDIGKQWMALTKPRKALMIGDTTHDYEVAQAMGADCILISQGHNSKTTLSQCGVPVFDNILEVLDFEHLSCHGLI